MSHSRDGSHKKGRGSLVALAALALSASVPLATQADAARSSKAGMKTTSPSIGKQQARKPPVGIPGRKDRGKR